MNPILSMPFPTQLSCTLITALAMCAAGFATEAAGNPVPSGREPGMANPILPGYYADPSLVADNGKWYLYATLDPWGGDTLGCWESADFTIWTYRALNWPTTAACTSATSGKAKVWAPSVVKAHDGKFYMYVSVGNEVWVGTADHPAGPWRNLLGNRPLIPRTYKPGFHMIDAEAFIDDDGTPYLYWGSGLNWRNGKCWAVRLQADMASFAGEVHDITPPTYFEGPFMVKRNGHYFLMNSTGKTIETSYQVHYAVGDNPFGPFREPADSTVLTSDPAHNILSPGHHAVFHKDGQDWILYHRQSIPFDRSFIGRQVCIDRLVLTPDGRIEPVIPTHTGPAFIQRTGPTGLSATATATASSIAGPAFAPECVLDDNNATHWAALAADPQPWLQLDLGAVVPVTQQELRFEYAWKSYRFIAEHSLDGSTWQMLVDHTAEGVSGSPIMIDRRCSARYLRLRFPVKGKSAAPALFSWNVR